MNILNVPKLYIHQIDAQKHFTQTSFDFFSKQYMPHTLYDHLWWD